MRALDKEYPIAISDSAAFILLSNGNTEPHMYNLETGVYCDREFTSALFGVCMESNWVVTRVSGNFSWLYNTAFYYDLSNNMPTD